MPSRIDHRVARIFPALVLEPACRAPLILLEAIAIKIAKVIDPVEATLGCITMLLEQLAILSPFPGLSNTIRYNGVASAVP